MADEWSRERDYHGVKIRKNAKTSSGDTPESVDLEIDLVISALDNGWIRNTAGTPLNQIIIVGKVHDTTGARGKPNERVKVQSHLTLKPKPGGEHGHLWLLPLDGEMVTPKTTVDPENRFTI